MLGKLVVAGVGLAMIILAIFQIQKRVKKNKDGLVADAKIIDYVMTGSDSWAYIYEFTTSRGKKITAQERYMSRDASEKRRRMNNRLRKVVYNPIDPYDFYDKGDNIGFLSGFIGILVIGIILFFVGLIVV